MGTYSKLLTQKPTPSVEVKNTPVSLPVEPEALKEVKITPISTRKVTRPRTVSSDKSRENSRNLPTRDEIQEFSFRLRDELKVKVQAEVPNGWQKELDELARELDVKKLELYRFMVGEFLGKVRRKAAN